MALPSVTAMTSLPVVSSMTEALVVMKVLLTEVAKPNCDFKPNRSASDS